MTDVSPRAPGARLPLLVFLHFLGGSAREWTEVIAHLGSEATSLTVDLPGFGDEAATGGYAVAEMVSHVRRRIAEAEPARFAVVGHSMGAKVAAGLARRAEDGDTALAGLSHLVLVAGSPPRPEPMEDDKRAAMLGWFEGDADARRREAERFLDDNVAEPLAGALRERAVDDVLRLHRPAWTAWLMDGSREDWTDRIGLLRTPTLLVAGADDGALGASVQRRDVAPHFLDVRLATVAEAGHLIPLEQPATLAGLIARHVEVHAADAAQAGVPADYARLIASARMGEATRAVLLGRLDPPDPAPAAHAFDAAQRATLAAIVGRVLPEVGQTIGLADAVALTLAGPDRKGWRYAVLPPGVEAVRAGLDDLEAAAARGGGSFAALPPAAQDALLAACADGSLPPGGSLDGTAMARWFEEVRAIAVRCYVGHPATLARLGYSGVARGGDGPHKTGFIDLGEGRREPWEPEGRAP